MLERETINTLAEFSAPADLYQALICRVRKYHPSDDISLIEKAFSIADEAHKTQFRKSGEPYIIHPLSVAMILAELELDKETIVAGILHDVVEDTVLTDKEIRDLTIDELRQYKLADSEYGIPTLQEVLEAINGKTAIMIELKPVNKKDKIEKIVYSLIKDYEGDIAVKSFNPFSMLWFKRHAPEILRGMLSSNFDGINMPWIYKTGIKNLWFYRLIKPDFISYNYINLPNKIVQKKNIPVIAWTIDSKEIEVKALKVANNIVFEQYIPDSPTNY